MSPLEIMDEVITYGAPEIEMLVDLLCPALAAFPVAALLRLADAAAKAVTSKRLDALRAGKSAADQAADLAEETALKS